MGDQQESGTIIAWNDDRAYGFIKRDNDARRNPSRNRGVFFHIADMSEGSTHRPAYGDRVVFTVRSTPKGLQAYNVEIMQYNEDKS